MADKADILGKERTDQEWIELLHKMDPSSKGQIETMEDLENWIDAQPEPQLEDQKRFYKLKGQKIKQDRKRNASIPMQFQNLRLDSFKVGCDKERVAKTVAETFIDDWPSFSGLLFHGMTGTGKTHLACVIANELLEREKIKNLKFVDVSNWFLELKEAVSRHKGVGKLRYKLIDPQLVILDDLVVDRDLTDFEVDCLRGVISKRYNNQTPYLVTTNTLLDNLEGHLDSRLLSRIRATVDPVDLDTYDHRQIKS